MKDAVKFSSSFPVPAAAKVVGALWLAAAGYLGYPLLSGGKNPAASAAVNYCPDIRPADAQYCQPGNQIPGP